MTTEEAHAMQNGPAIADTPKMLPAVKSEFLTALQTSSLAAQSIQQLQDAFSPLFDQAEEWAKKVPAIVITDASQVREMKLARETRLALRDIRIKAENTRVTLGDEARQRVKAVNFIYNLLEAQIKPLEAGLLEQEKFVENKEAERKAKLAETRKQALAVFGLDTSFYNLGEMEEATYAQLHDNTRLAHEAKVEAQRRIEAERIAKEAAELAERERVKAENERLRAEAAAASEAKRIEDARLAKEAEEREAALKAERDRVAKEKSEAEAKAAKELAEANAKAKAEQDAIEAKALAEREALEAASKAEREAIERKAREDLALAAATAKAQADEIQRKADAETARVNEANRQERLRLQALAEVERVKAETAAAAAKVEKDALEAKLAQERAAAAKAESDRVAAAKAIEDARIAALVKAERDREAANKAPDTEKLMTLATTIRGLVLPELLSEAGKAIAPQINSQLEKFAAWVEGKAKGLG